MAGNLPYYITSPIIERVLALGPNLLHAVFLVQKEVAERIAAQPGSRDYGYLIRSGAGLRRAEVPVHRASLRVSSRRLRSIRPSSSSNPARRPITDDPAGLVQFAGLCFRQKRKMLRNNLSGSFPQEAIDAQPEARLRAEQLSVAQLADLRDRILKFQ